MGGTAGVAVSGGGLVAAGLAVTGARVRVAVASGWEGVTVGRGVAVSGSAVVVTGM